MVDRLLDAVRGAFPDMADIVAGALVAQFRPLLDEAVFEQANKLVAEVDESRRVLLRQLDVALNGEAGAAKSPSLCDLVAQVERQQRAVHIVNFDDGMVINFRAPDGRRATLNLAALLTHFAESAPSDGLVVPVMRDAIAAYPSVGPRVPAANGLEKFGRSAITVAGDA